MDPMQPGAALSNITVIEFGDGIAVAYCGALLAACGAQVIKIEAPIDGDSVRFLPPFRKGAPGGEASGMHAFLNARKKSVTLAMDDPKQAASAFHLAICADVVLEGFGAGAADAYGLGYEALRSANPNLVMSSLSWFGADGPRTRWQGTDAIAQALSGFLYPIGPAEGPPVIPGGYNAQITAGLTSFIALMVGLVNVEAGRGGAYIDQSVLEAQLTYTETTGVRAAYDNAITLRKGLNKFAPTYPQTVYPAADGWIGVTVLTPAQWSACCEMLGAPELTNDPRFRTAKERCDRADDLDRVLKPLFLKRNAHEWFHEGQARRVPLALVPSLGEMLELDHFRGREVWANYGHPELGEFAAPVIPWKLSASPLHRGGVAARLGQHTETISAANWQLDRFRPESAIRSKKGVSESGEMRPLREMKIVDFTMGWSGPLATRHLADMGAEVIKIEACKYPDWWRGWDYSPESIDNKEYEKSPAFNQINRNKLGVAIDLSNRLGRNLALNLIKRADAVIENQATGVMDKLGLGYDILREVNPSLVMLSLPAFGAVGPWSTYRGYGSTVEHGAGLPHLTGEENGPPVQTHVAYGDACGGLNAAAALLTAFYHRAKTGQGQRVEISQVECIMQLGIHGGITQGMTGIPPARTGNRHPVFVPHGCFPCQESDSWLVVAISRDEQWPRLAETIGRLDLAEKEILKGPSGRRSHEAEIEKAIAEWSVTMQRDSAMELLQKNGVPAASVLRGSELLTEPGLIERGYWSDVERAIVGFKPHPLTPWRYDGKRAPIHRPAPLLGEHNALVLSQMLGLSGDEIASLERCGVIGDTPSPS